MRNRSTWLLLLMSIITLLAVISNLFFGAIIVPPKDVWAAIIGAECDDAIRYIIMEGRLPSAITALLGGAGLAASGLMLQTAFRNPLAGPSILGITSGASLGVALVVLTTGGLFTFGAESLSDNFAVTTGALLGSFAVMGLLIALSARVRGNLTLLIAGMMTGYLASSLVTLLSSLSTAQGIQNYVMWGMGTFTDVPMSRMPLFASLTIGALFLSMLLAKPLNLLLLGDNYAANLGVNVKSVRNLLLLATGILSAIVTAYCGPISFIGLAMPHIARMIFRTDDHLVLMPATMLCGSLLALVCNVISVLPEGNIIPVNALTPIAGVPVVLYVILKKNK